MQRLTAADIAKATGGRLICGGEDIAVSGIAADSRKIKAGMLFIPIKGANMDGHDYISSAFENGAAAVITHRDTAPVKGKAVIRVDDTFEAVARLAAYYKRMYPVPTVAVTGSVGKTTTKDMIASVLSTKYKTLKTSGNMNNELGVPLTVFGLEKEHEAAVIEMGMSGFGEIRKLASVAQPNAAVITNIGMSHIEKLGSREGIFRAKMEVAEQLGAQDTLIVNGDDLFLGSVKGSVGCRAVYYGIDNPKNDYYADNIENLGIDGTRFDICREGARRRVHVRAAGEHNVYNALAAAAAGEVFGLNMDEIAEGIENAEFCAMRMEITEHNGVTVINDCYNASPDSVKAALKVLMSTKAKRHIAVLGDILEMGSFARDAHYELGAQAARLGVDCLITAGANSLYTKKGAEEYDGEVKPEVAYFFTTGEAAEYAAKTVRAGDAVLVKASRGMYFEEVCRKITEDKDNV